MKLKSSKKIITAAIDKIVSIEKIKSNQNFDVNSISKIEDQIPARKNTDNNASSIEKMMNKNENEKQGGKIMSKLLKIDNEKKVTKNIFINSEIKNSRLIVTDQSHLKKTPKKVEFEGEKFEKKLF